MDEINLNILNQLKQNARASVSEISKVVKLSVPAVAERIRKMEQEGLIEKYPAKINRRKLGFRLLAFILVSLDSAEQIEPFRKNILALANVLECHHIAGPHDYLLKVLVTDTAMLELFLTDKLKKLPGVSASNTLICLSTLKEEINI